MNCLNDEMTILDSTNTDGGWLLTCAWSQFKGHVKSRVWSVKLGFSLFVMDFLATLDDNDFISALGKWDFIQVVTKAHQDFVDWKVALFSLD